MPPSPEVLRKRLRSYRTARAGSIFLAVVLWFGFPLFFITGEMGDASWAVAERAATYAAVFFWPAMASICHLKIRLIRIELAASADAAREGVGKTTLP